MASNKRITDLTDYTSVLPYASELFGVYQPLIGWKSKRRVDRIKAPFTGSGVLITELLPYFKGDTQVEFDSDHQPESARVGIGETHLHLVQPAIDSQLIRVIAEKLSGNRNRPNEDELKELLSEDALRGMLEGPVFESYRADWPRRWSEEFEHGGGDVAKMKRQFVTELNRESAIAGAIHRLLNTGHYGQVIRLFYSGTGPAKQVHKILTALERQFEDPYLTFDPRRDVKDVTLSPIGIVHLFRQFFFELDTFLGTPVSHVWLSPGSSVELVEVSTRKVIVERTIATFQEYTSKSERSLTEQDEISDAVKQDNRSNMKLGFSTTVNQSWGSGNATATGSLEINKTQQTARDQGHKRMRQQTEKLSTEIRQNYKSTFKTITETTDTSSKRYLLANSTPDLMNYELRRKMRQVGVQIQDVGTYLCWETFVDDPGDGLALPNLIHIAKPADLVAVPNANTIDMPPLTLSIGFAGEAVWHFPSNDRQHQENHPETRGQFVPIGNIEISGIPPDYEVAYDHANPFVAVEKTVIAAGDEDSWNATNWGFKGIITPDGKRVLVGVATAPKPGGLAWDDRITFKVSGSVPLRLLASKKDEISKANSELMAAKVAANAENQRKFEAAFREAVRDRVTLASKIQERKFEALREEERTVVYRRLIQSLMTVSHYQHSPNTPQGNQTRHVLSELINAIFDVDKMLYFVAPEWWKPRRSAALSLGGQQIGSSVEDTMVRWADDQAHSKYFITDQSDPAPVGSSLGWLMQLDGDDLRNAFLNAPWVKAVIPIRPGKEQAAINWLKNVGVEGSDGLDAAYAAPEDELDMIRESLLANDPADPVSGHNQVTIDDAIRNLCLQVAEKHKLSSTVGRYPENGVSEENRVSALPVEKVYEHGFYPLQGGFKAVTEGPFEICSQWIEVLPTDQVVPVEVKYDPRSGRQIVDTPPIT